MQKYFKNHKFWKIIGLAVLVSTIFILTVHAQVILPDQFRPEYAPAVPVKENASGATFVNYFLQMIAGALINVAAPVAIIIIAIGGLLAVISHGNADLQGKAKKALSGAIIGLIIIILSWVIVQTVINLAIETTNKTEVGAPAGQSETTPQSQSPSAQPGSSGGPTAGG